MPEIELCDEEGCKRRKRCYRGVAEPDSVQDYGHFPLGLDGECGGFLPLPDLMRGNTKQFKNGEFDVADTPVIDRGNSSFEPEKKTPKKVFVLHRRTRPMKAGEARDLKYWPVNKPAPEGWRDVVPMGAHHWRGKIIERVEAKNEPK